MNILNWSLEEKVNLYNRCKELYYTGDKESPLTDIEFDELENIRTAFILENGIKVCRIICTSDKVPDDNTLLSIKQDII